MCRTLVKWALVTVMALSMLSCASAPKYHMFEGPPRLEMKAPRNLRTGQQFILKARLLGDQNVLPFDEYVIVVIKANDTVMGTRQFVLTQRNFTGIMAFTVEFYNMFKGGYGRMDTPLDYTDPMPVMEPIEGFDENDPDLDVKIQMEIWIGEIDYRNQVVPVKRLVQQKFNTKLSCVHQGCQVGMY